MHPGVASMAGFHHFEYCVIMLNSAILIGVLVSLCKSTCMLMRCKHPSTLPSRHLKWTDGNVHLGGCHCPLEVQAGRCCGGGNSLHGWLVSSRGSSESLGVLIHHLKNTESSTDLADCWKDYQGSVPSRRTRWRVEMSRWTHLKSLRLLYWHR